MYGLTLLQYGDFFTFGLLGMKVTVFLGAKGNNFILNGKLKDLNAEVRAVTSHEWVWARILTDPRKSMVP